jgi:transcriptional regulator with XRE-family HTH domain
MQDIAKPNSSIVPNDQTMNLKRQLKSLLESKDMTASQLARKAGVPKQSISGWLSGSNPRDIRQLKKVADALGTSVDHLVFGDGSVTERLVHLDGLIDDSWISGLFEVKLRRVKK